MRGIRAFFVRLAGSFRKKSHERDLSEEIESNLELHSADNVRAGMNPADARRDALLKLGGIENTKEEYRDRRTIPMLETLLQDLRYGSRILLKNPGFTGVAFLTLALGIGANATIFSFVKGILLEPPPFRDPARLVAVLDSRPSQGVDWLNVTPNRYEEWLRRNTVFDEMAAVGTCHYRLESAGAPLLLQGGCASASFFPMLGVQALLGRLFTPDEDRAGTRVVLLSYGCWKEHFGGDPGVLGKSIRRTANDALFTIIGVLPASFKFATEDFALWAPLNSDPNYRYRDDRNPIVFARLKQGVTLPKAQSAMDGVAQQLAREFPKSAGWNITVRPLQSFYSSVRNIRLTLWVLFGAVGALLLIACANLANLLLARSTLRGKEISVRFALGANRSRVIRQLVTENVLLALLGGAAGFLLARLALKSLLAITPYMPSFRPDAIRVDHRVFLFSMVCALFAGIAFGLAPALRASRYDLNHNLREAGRSVRGGAGDRLTRGVVVASEIALAVVLVSGAGLLTGSFKNLLTDRIGFNPAHILTTGICCLDEAHYRTERDVSAYYAQLFERLRSIPGVESASGVSTLPLRQFQGAGLEYEVRGSPSQIAGNRTADFFYVEPRYFETLQIRVVRGRAFTESDGVDGTPAAMINESLARRVWPGKDPIGQEIRIVAGDPGLRWYRIIGVAADAKERGLGTNPQPAIYRSYYQSLGRYTFLLVRTRPDPLSLAADIRKVIASVNNTLPLFKIGTLENQMADSVSAQRFSMFLLVVFAGLALSLGVVGVYGVTACTVAQRRQEIGIRMALGASRSAIVRMFLRENLVLSGVGLGAGLLVALGLTRFLQSLLYGISANDPLILTGAIAILALVTSLACFLPARRAMRADPMTALRCE